MSQQSNFVTWLQCVHVCHTEILAKMFKIKYCAWVLAVHFLSQVHSKLDTRIINGVSANRNQYPFYVKLTITEMKMLILLTAKHECGGTLISENAVITAAHCLHFEKQIMVRALLGFYDANDVGEQQRHTSKENIVHEKYDPKTLANDIALVVLATNVKFTDAVRALSISCEYTQPETVVTVIGDGLLNSSDDELPNRLHWTTLTTIPNEVCAEFYGDVPATLMCADGNSAKGQSTCHGDSGGPVVRTKNETMKLIALVSFGAFAQCSGDVPVAFTRVASYSNWIGEKTNHSLTCS